MQSLYAIDDGLEMNEWDIATLPTFQKTLRRAPVGIVGAQFGLAVEEEKAAKNITIRWDLAAEEFFERLINPKLWINLWFSRSCRCHNGMCNKEVNNEK